jgi:prevent-host-death family protein
MAMRNCPYAECPDLGRRQVCIQYADDVLIPLTEARRRLGRLITEARISGEPVTITDRDEPVATLVPVIPPPRPAAGTGGQ